MSVKKQLNSTQDDLLADFADQAIEGRMQKTASTLDQELLSLERTILHLRDVLPPVSLDEAAMKQMQVRLKARIKREERDAPKSFWEKWFGQAQIVPQIGMALGAVALLVIFAVISPLLATAGSSATTATAFAPEQSLFTGAAILAVVVILILWKMRRK